MWTCASGSVRVLLCLGVLLASGCGGSVGQDPNATHSGGSSGSGGNAGNGGSSGGCDYQGKHYAEGQVWSADCNSCTCSGGQAECGLALCGCEYNGAFHGTGTSFPAGDGCNTCTCQSSNQVACTELACAPGCDYNGTHYDPGQSWSLDGCNSCTCMPDGNVGCTGTYCPPCIYAGQQYQVGQSFPSLDGCNTCTCEASGVGCTKVACQCDPSKEWWRNYVTTDPATCATVKYSCPANTTAFQNDCGCGCEEDQSCPQVVNCMPPAPDCNDQMAKCPFSSVSK